MARQKEPARPYYDTKHEHAAALKEYENAATMLHNTAKTCVQLISADNWQRLAEQLREHVEAFDRAAYGREATDV